MFGFIAQSSERAAANFSADMSAKMVWIAETGFSGVARDWIRPGLRAFPYRDRCFYFRIDEEAVHILRVLHGKQDIERQEFGDSPG
jgi:toxin ParE1/3/4